MNHIFCSGLVEVFCDTSKVLSGLIEILGIDRRSELSNFRLQNRLDGSVAGTSLFTLS